MARVDMSLVLLIGEVVVVVVDTRAELGAPDGLFAIPSLPKCSSTARPSGERRSLVLLYSTVVGLFRTPVERRSSTSG
jgi:hypothetical protein